jgi:ATP-dependent DNA ligase
MASKSITVKNYHTEVPGEITADKRMWLFPQVNSVNSNGKTTEWRIAVRVFKLTPTIVLPNIPESAFLQFNTSFLDNKPLPEDIRGWIKVDSKIGNGEVRTSIPTIIHSGNNEGKKNATNVVCQALRDAYSLHNKQLKKSSINIANGDTTRYPPMLAQVLSEQKKQPNYADDSNPIYIQRKYNGVRTVATIDFKEINGVRVPTVIMYSRRKNLYLGFNYMKEELFPVLDMYWEAGRKLYLDGEVYSHGTPLQDISGQSRRESNSSDAKYTYMIYDCFIENEPNLLYSQRKEIIDEIFSNFDFKYVENVETFRVSSKEEIDALYNQFLNEKYEGAMIRTNTKYIYSYNEKHSKNLLKIKPRMDAEYPISGYDVGKKGKAAGALMILCKIKKPDDAYIEFPVTPAMEIIPRIELAKQMATVINGKTFFEENYLNKPLIVYFDELSKDGVPQRASTKMEIRTWD